jgi:hypothetical protein
MTTLNIFVKWNYNKLELEVATRQSIVFSANEHSPSGSLSPGTACHPPSKNATTKSSPPSAKHICGSKIVQLSVSFKPTAASGCIYVVVAFLQATASCVRLFRH